MFAQRFTQPFNYDLFKSEVMCRYLSYKITHTWTDLRGLLLLTLGKNAHYLPLENNPPYLRISGQFDQKNQKNLGENSLKNPLHCYLSPEKFPFQEYSVDRILYIYDPFLNKKNLSLLLRSCWNTLSDNGKLILLLPNKWYWDSLKYNFSTKSGHSFYFKSLERLLKQQSFRINHHEKIIFPSSLFMDLFPFRVNLVIESICNYFIPFLGGFHFIEVEKDLYAPLPIKIVKKRIFLPQGASHSS